MPARIFAAVTCALLLADPVAAGGCFDVAVRARPVAQVPSEVPDCADCLVMRWPWFLDLAVTRTLAGPSPGARVTVLAMQHNAFRDRLGTWRLRHNTAGGYNLVTGGDGRRLRRCPAGLPPAPAYLRPGPGTTLDALRRAGEARYGPGG